MKHMSKNKNDVICVLEYKNVSLLTKFCITKEALWLPDSQDARFSRTTWSGSFPSLANSLTSAGTCVSTRDMVSLCPALLKQS